MTLSADKLKSLDNWAKAGFAARGLVYLLFGYAVLATGGGASKRGTIDMMLELPAGTLLLALVAVGLVGYALFRLYEAAFDIDNDKDGGEGLVSRLGRLFSGIAYGALAYFAFSALLGEGSGSPGEESAREEMTRQAVQTGGEWILIAIAAIILFAAFRQLHKAWTCDFWFQCSGAPDIVKQFGRFGYAARGAVFGLVGGFMMQSALDRENGIRTTREALNAIREHDWAVTAIGIGLILFGLFSLALAKYRRLPRGEGVDEAKRRVKEKLGG